MKICIVIPKLPIHVHAGAEILCYYTAKELTRRGHAVVMIAAGHPHYREYVRMDGIEVYFLQNIQAEKSGGFAGRFQKMAMRKFEELQIKYGFDILLIRGKSGFFWARENIHRKYNTKLVVFMHGSPYYQSVKYPLSLIEELPIAKKMRKACKIWWDYLRFFIGYERYIKNADAFVSVSEKNISLAKKIYPLKQNRLFTVYDGVNVEHFHPQRRRDSIREELGIQKDEPLLIFIARLEELKGPHIAIRALTKVIEEMPTAKLLICGDGNYKREVEQLIKGLQLGAHVILHPSVAYEDMPVFINSADLFINPSIYLGGYETVMLEAMACERVIITHNSGTMATVIKDGINGIFFRYKSPEDLAKKIIYALNQPRQWRMNIGRQARRDVIEKFSVETMGGGMEEALYSALGKNG